MRLRLLPLSLMAARKLRLKLRLAKEFSCLLGQKLRIVFSKKPIMLINGPKCGKKMSYVLK